MHLKVPPPLIALTCAGLMWGLATTAPALIPSPPQKTIAAIAIASVGILFGMFGIVSFLFARTTVSPHRPERTRILVESGLYRWTRNPMYLGLLLMQIAWGVYLAHAPALLLPALFVIYMNRFQIGPEEDVLSRTFGASYDRYCQRVRRWI